jgi:uncharacterized RDD family membrane protein YckC
MPRPEKPDEPLLFDLPLDVPERSRQAGSAERKRPVPEKAPAPRPVMAIDETGELDDEELAEAQEAEAGSDRKSGTGAGARLVAGAADLLVHAAVVVVLLVGVHMMGVRPVRTDWPALGVFLLAFSFLYMVVPLAFWGHTLGMAWAGLSARNQDGEPLTFDQTARRWLGGLLTLGFAGLPLLLTGKGRSLTDRLSGSTTYAGQRAAD